MRIDARTKKQLEALAGRARRSKSFLAAEAITVFVATETWQLNEMEAGLKELDAGRLGRPGRLAGTRELVVSGTPACRNLRLFIPGAGTWR